MKKRFRGSFILKIDDRSRIKIPSQYKNILENQYGKEVYLTSVNNDHILFYPLKTWETIEQKIEKNKFRSRKIEDFIRLTSYWGTETEIDPRGRILIPSKLREKINLQENVLIIGQIDYLAIWNCEEYESKYASKSFSDRELDEISRILNDEPALSGNE